MNKGIALLSILNKDIRNYYLKPPNISWGMIFPLAWTLMFVLRSETEVDLIEILPGVMALSILFGTTSMLAVTITFEKKQKSFERLMLAPVSLYSLMLAKTGGAIIFGILNAMVPLLLGIALTGLRAINWPVLMGAILLIAVTSTFLGLMIAVAAKEVFEAQTFSNFFRFPMIFLCGLFIPIQDLPALIRPISYMLPLTYGVDLLKLAIQTESMRSVYLNFSLLLIFSFGLFRYSIHRMENNWMN
ncbi:ABC-2 type transport system permease protein [Tindallia magadiensis]|uniref:Transport permease protein n=1 Tax=Tindallia magadiensis TaxID=69895 RepID=A0A1I3E3B8_9FIRM|nr:ABC transporter permease [Tindallia magadiensis]SFH93476.1 ABC-2 type transport system permease protein [Tindallia magadiensis]